MFQKKIILIILCIFLFNLSAYSSDIQTSVKNNDSSSSRIFEIKNLRTCLDKKKIRSVIDVCGSGEYKFNISKNPFSIIITFYNAIIDKDVDDFRNYASDSLLKNIIINRVNFNQTEIIYNLDYELPEENISFRLFDNPKRFVIDLKRNYSIVEEFHVTGNIRWTQKKVASYYGYFLINELTVNLKDPDVWIEIFSVPSGDMLKNISEISIENNALIAINGGYFSKELKTPMGLLIKDNKIVNLPVTYRPPRTAFGITKDEKIIMDRIIVRDDQVYSIEGKKWEEVIWALQAGPRLIKNGRVFLTADIEGLGKKGNNITKPAGRSVIGEKNNSELYFATFSTWYDNHSKGILLNKLAEYLAGQKIKNAMNLDGGGSTAMAIKGYNVSLPPGGTGFQRKISSAILIFDKSPLLLPSKMNIQTQNMELFATGSETTKILVDIKYENDKPVKDHTKVYAMATLGKIEPSYVYTINGKAEFKYISPARTGNAVLKFSSGFINKTVNIKLLPMECKNILTCVEPVQNIHDENSDEKIYQLQVLLTDDFNNVIENQPVFVKSDDPDVKIDSSDSKTDKSGIFNAVITYPKYKDNKFKLQIISKDITKTIEI